MDDLEKVEVENILSKIPSISFLQEWIGEHVFEIVLVLCFLALVVYKYGQKEISMATGYKSVLDQLTDGINNLFGRFWLSSNMQGKAIKTKVRFNEDENEEYSDGEDDRYTEKKAVMYI
jgi:hypothetical protein